MQIPFLIKNELNIIVSKWKTWSFSTVVSLQNAKFSWTLPSLLDWALELKLTVPLIKQFIFIISCNSILYFRDVCFIPGIIFACKLNLIRTNFFFENRLILSSSYCGFTYQPCFWERINVFINKYKIKNSFNFLGGFLMNQKSRTHFEKFVQSCYHFFKTHFCIAIMFNYSENQKTLEKEDDIETLLNSVFDLTKQL